MNIETIIYSIFFYGGDNTLSKYLKYPYTLLLLIVMSFTFCLNIYFNEITVLFNDFINIFFIAIFSLIFIILAMNEVTIVENGYEKVYRFTSSIIMVALLTCGNKIAVISVFSGMIVYLILSSIRNRRINIFDIVQKLATTIIPVSLMCWIFVKLGGAKYPNVNFPINFLLIMFVSVINYIANTTITILNTYAQEKKIRKSFLKVFFQEYGWILKYDIWQAIFAVLFYNAAFVFIYNNWSSNPNKNILLFDSYEFVYFLSWISIMITILYISLNGWLSSFKTFINYNKQNVLNVINDMQEGIIILDSKGYIENLNSSAISLFEVLIKLNKGMFFAEFIKKIESSIVDGENKGNQIIKAITQGTHSSKIEITIKGNMDLYYDIKITPEVNRFSEITGTVISIENVTSFRDMINEINIKNIKLEEYRADLEQSLNELQETQEQLIISEKMAVIGQLVAGVAHEINTPLASIKSNVDMEKMIVDMVDVSDADSILNLKENITSMNEVSLMALDRIIEIVKSLKNFARLDEAELKEVNIHEGIDSTVMLINNQISSNINIVKEYGVIPQLKCFPQQLNQVFLNLLVNAIQAVEDKGEILIKTWSDDNKVYIKIKDSGKGISTENINKIFNPGFTTKGVGVGTGLGLSICYKIINKHNGKILVESQIGVGTEFIIELPNSMLEGAKNYE